MRRTTRPLSRGLAVPPHTRGKGRTRRKVAFAICILAATSAVFAGTRLVESSGESPRFILAALEIEGLERLDGRQIMSASGLSVGDNILDLDLQVVQDRIEEIPWVERTVIVRKPPDRLVISLVERQRSAWIDDRALRTVDVNGVLLPEIGPEDSIENLDLPVITGINVSLDSIRIGEAVADSSLTRILGWLREANAADRDFCMNISEIMPMGDGAIRILLVGDGLEVRMPHNNVRDRLRVLRTALPRIYRDCLEPAYVDLRFARQVVVGTGDGAS
jgi:cell division protein FtsQ